MLRIRSLILGLWVLALMGLGFGCGSDPELPELPEFSTPTPVFLEGDGFYVGAEDRLVIPTMTPAPSPTPRVLAVVLSDVDRRGAPTPTPLPAALAALFDVPEEGILSCMDQYRRMLIDYRGRVPFGPEVAEQLSDGMLSVRKDCGEEGWAPEFGLEIVCVGLRVSGLRISDGFVVWEGAKEKYPRVLSTRRDGNGNLLVHFKRLPFQESRGCWYYDTVRLSWAWVVSKDSGAEGGVDRPEFPVCEGYLRNLVDDVGGEGVRALEVARLVDRVRADLPSECETKLWDIYPRLSWNPGCEVQGDTGLLPDGSLLLNWHPEHLASDGAVCWLRNGESGEWRPFYEVVVETQVVEEVVEVVEEVGDQVGSSENPNVIRMVQEDEGLVEEELGEGEDELSEDEGELGAEENEMGEEEELGAGANELGEDEEGEESVGMADGALEVGRDVSP